jgi:hypothetical protein
MAAGDFTAFGDVSRPTNCAYNNNIGNLNVSAMADANRGALIGDVNYNTPVGTVGYSKGLNSPKDMYYKYNGENINLEARPNNLSAGYQNGNLSARGNVNPYGYDMGLNLNIPMVNPNDNASIGATYNSYDQTPAVQAQIRKQMFDNGFIDASGNLTPKGYEFRLSGGFNF